MKAEMKLRQLQAILGIVQQIARVAGTSDRYESDFDTLVTQITQAGKRACSSVSFSLSKLVPNSSSKECSQVCTDELNLYVYAYAGDICNLGADACICMFVKDNPTEPLPAPDDKGKGKAVQDMGPCPIPVFGQFGGWDAAVHSFVPGGTSSETPRLYRPLHHLISSIANQYPSKNHQEAGSSTARKIHFPGGTSSQALPKIDVPPKPGQIVWVSTCLCSLMVEYQHYRVESSSAFRFSASSNPAAEQCALPEAAKRHAVAGWQLDGQRTSRTPPFDCLQPPKLARRGDTFCDNVLTAPQCRRVHTLPLTLFTAQPEPVGIAQVEQYHEHVALNDVPLNSEEGNSGYSASGTSGSRFELPDDVVEPSDVESDDEVIDVGDYADGEHGSEDSQVLDYGGSGVGYLADDSDGSDADSSDDEEEHAELGAQDEANHVEPGHALQNEADLMDDDDVELENEIQGDIDWLAENNFEDEGFDSNGEEHDAEQDHATDDDHVAQSDVSSHASP
ncbi:hypothetical protein BCR37DRAFT_388585 [Protomyces lactucae-debilis]|uniref:Uncharacterized protein n=1 Tax=Protomyces lactucae-debilis TaxID=2754530 RepID=A0A1Y2F6K4_PROLT|nr:uncharacterized protein BCR37DRAFT_388585 [Protomyces lactucae-debilis]ORY78956.1 hypothetical protein BCR37DRAFT_388585 [Protomyces lactucae-debilis]